MFVVCGTIPPFVDTHRRFLLHARSIGASGKMGGGASRNDNPRIHSLCQVHHSNMSFPFSGPSSLHTLGLRWLNVEPAQQQLILSIKSLQFLKLVNSSFVPTSVVMPRSSITTLWIEDLLAAPTKHLLTLLASSLETLRSRRMRSEAIDVLGGTRLPRLMFLEEVYPEHIPKWDHLASFSNIKVLIISSFRQRLPPGSNGHPPPPYPPLCPTQRR